MVYLGWDLLWASLCGEEDGEERIDFVEYRARGESYVGLLFVSFIVVANGVVALLPAAIVAVIV